MGSYIRTKEFREKMSKIKKGTHPKSEFKKGNHPRTEFKKGYKMSDEHKDKISKSLKGRAPKNSLNWKGENHPGWKGGISYEPYSVDWTKTLKRSIRERDKYRCFLCGEPQTNKVLIVHHIDYNKKNCNSNNLVTLCNVCHGKTNHNRDYWINYFKQNFPYAQAS